MLRDRYPLAQQAFVDLEVFEHLKSREVIQRLARSFELLADAVQQCSSAKVEEARAFLEKITIDCRLFLCNERLKELGRFDRWGWLARVLLFQAAFTPEADACFRHAVRAYEQGQECSRSFPQRIALLQTAFENLDHALALVQPHRLYDRLFSVILGIIFVFLGVSLAFVFT